MKKECYGVLIVEDDFRVAAINREFMEEAEHFTVLDVCKTGKEALDYLETHEKKPELILLDVYIPDVNGLELLWEIRTRYRDIDIIMVTAAKEVETIQEAIRGGVFDYLIKPLAKKRVHHSLERYRQKRMAFLQKQEFTQQEIDQLQMEGRTMSEPAPHGQLPKGIDRYTAEKIRAVLDKNKHQGLTAMEGAKQIGASRSTMRRYLEYFISTGTVKAEMIYGDVGRPERRYFPI